MAKTTFELDKLRRGHLATITSVSDLEWFRVALAGGATIEVCYPFAADELWIPVTAQEQWTLAAKLRVFPLTRAVADQAHMTADNGAGAEKYLAGAYGLDFEASSKQVNLQRRYSTFYGWQPISGVHKVWLLSNGPYPPGDSKGMAVNYGFYTPTRTKVKNDGGGVPGGEIPQGLVRRPGPRHGAQQKLLGLFPAPSVHEELHPRRRGRGPARRPAQRGPRRLGRAEQTPAGAAAVLTGAAPPDPTESGSTTMAELEHFSRRLRDELDQPPPTAPAKPVLTLKELPGQTGRMVPTDFYYVDPNSVENDWLMFFGRPIDPIGIDVWVYELNRSVVPKWFGVGVPPGLTEFTRPHVFFHPTPGQAHYDDKDYPTLSGKWRANLVGYIQRMGSQLVFAKRKQVLVMPFLTEGVAGTLGIFAAEWHAIVTEILALLSKRYTPAARSPQITDLVTSSFSAGVKYMHTFLNKGVRVKELVRECYDFDGRYSKPYRHLSERLKVTGTMTVVNYDQAAVKTIEEVKRDALGGRGVHVPLPRWEKFKDTPQNQDDVHAAIPRHMMRHAMTRSKVG